MSSQSYWTAGVAAVSNRMWGGAIAGGLVAGVGMGLVMHFGMNAMALVGALYGQPSVAFGWVAHLFHSVVFALVFAVVVARPRFSEYGLVGITGLGAAYGIVLEIVAAGFVLPIWANAVGAASLPVPFLVPMGLVTHLIYGILLGAVFWFVTARLGRESAASERAEGPAA